MKASFVLPLPLLYQLLKDSSFLKKCDASLVRSVSNMHYALFRCENNLYNIHVK